MHFNSQSFPSRRSNVMARRGMVATSQPLAAQAGLDILQAGGNAVDAAIATAAVLCVVEPFSTGIGGDAFALIWQAAEERLYGLNASGPAPAALTAEWIRQQGYRQVPASGGIPVTVPGSLRGWELALERFGTMDLAALLQPAIDYGEEGFPVSEMIARAWRRSQEKMSRQAHSRRQWLVRGRAPRAGEIFRNRRLATTLQLIADEGVGVFYEGSLAQRMVRTIQEEGGLLAEADLANYRAQWVEPLSCDYGGGYVFHEIPPNGQGLAALLALNIARGFDLSALDYDSPQRWHLLIESMKLAFADAAAYIADPDQADVPVAGLLSSTYADERRALIRPDQALRPQPGSPGPHGDTVYVTVADAAGNMVSWIQSLYMAFGSGLTAGDTGICLQNRGANFSLEPGHPNQLVPGKRPYHTIIPGFISHDGQAWASFGVMGGFMQPQGHLQVGVNLLDHGMDPQSALDAPRFRWLQGRRVALEESVAPAVRRTLAAMGHQVTEANHYGGARSSCVTHRPECSSPAAIRVKMGQPWAIEAVAICCPLPVAGL